MCECVAMTSRWRIWRWMVDGWLAAEMEVEVEEAGNGGQLGQWIEIGMMEEWNVFVMRAAAASAGGIGNDNHGSSK